MWCWNYTGESWFYFCTSGGRTGNKVAQFSWLKALSVCGCCAEYPPYRWKGFNTEYGGTMFLQNVDNLLHDYTAQHPRRQCSSLSPSRDTEIQGNMCLDRCSHFHTFENTLRNRTPATNNIQHYITHVCKRDQKIQDITREIISIIYSWKYIWYSYYLINLK
jgi:predicted PolB exonuclease-like 3'-5' exonuclease